MNKCLKSVWLHHGLLVESGEESQMVHSDALEVKLTTIYNNSHNNNNNNNTKIKTMLQQISQQGPYC